MSELTICTCIMAILFFMAGCLQIGIYVGTVEMTTMPAYLPGLLISAWPLAVAGVIFALLDVRLQIAAAGASAQPAPDHHLPPPTPTPQPAAVARRATAPAATAPAATKVMDTAAAPEGSYFYAYTQAPPEQKAPTPAESAPRPAHSAQAPAEPQQQSPQDSGLSFFKL